MSTTQDQLLPKKKFAFKSRQKKSPATESSSTASSSPPVSVKPSIPELVGDAEKLVGFRDRENENLSLSVSLDNIILIHIVL